MKRSILFLAVIFGFAACNNGKTSSSSADSVRINSGASTPPKTSLPTGTGGNAMDSARTNPTIGNSADSSH